MLNPDEIGRAADAVTAIRPDWDTGVIADYLEEHHAHRPLAVLVAAAVYVASDPLAKDLSGLELPGRWWIQPAAPRQRTEPVERRIGPKRDEAWWAKYNAAAAQRAIAFGPRNQNPAAEQ